MLGCIRREPSSKIEIRRHTFMRQFLTVPVVLLSIMVCVALTAQQAPKDSKPAKPGPVKEQKWYTTEIPLTVDHLKFPGHETADAQGFWQPISTSKEKQLVDVIAVKIECIREGGVCREADA